MAETAASAAPAPAPKKKKKKSRAKKPVLTNKQKAARKAGKKRKLASAKKVVAKSAVKRTAAAKIIADVYTSLEKLSDKDLKNTKKYVDQLLSTRRKKASGIAAAG